MTLQPPPGVALWPSDLPQPRRGVIEVATHAISIELRQYRFGRAEAIFSRRAYPSQPWAPVLVAVYRVTRLGARQHLWALADAAHQAGLDAGLELR